MRAVYFKQESFSAALPADGAGIDLTQSGRLGTAGAASHAEGGT